MIIRDTFVPDVEALPVDWRAVPVEVLAAEAASDDPDEGALAELARRGTR